MFIIKKRTEKKTEKITIENIVGVKFKVLNNDNTVFEVKSIKKNKITITWRDTSLSESNTIYDIENVIYYFAKGDWIEIKK